MIYLSNISKNYGTEKVLDKIRFQFPSKGLVFIKGISGGGKTTLLNIIGGLLSDYDGGVYFGDLRLNKNESHKYLQTTVSYIMQSDNLIKDLTLKENLEIPFRIRNSKASINKLMKSLMLENLLNKKVKFLSLGEQQRAALARSILVPSKVLLLDEPTGSLNEENTKIVMDIVRKVAKKKLVIFVTHNEKLIRNNDLSLVLKDNKLKGERKRVKTTDTPNIEYIKTKVKNLILLTLKCIKTSLKQIVMLSLTISSIIASSLAGEKITGGLNNKIANEFSVLFEYRHLQKSDNKRDLSLDEFKDLTEDFKVYLEDYFYDLNDPELYNYKVSVSDLYLGNGFVMSQTGYIDKGLSNDEIIIGGESGRLCQSLIIQNCSVDKLKEFLIAKKITIGNNQKKFTYTVRDYLESDSIVIFSNNRYLNELLIKNPEVINFYFVIKENMIKEFYHYINNYTYLDFIKVNEEENIFKVNIAKNAFYSQKELMNFNFEYIYCSINGYDCLANYGRGSFSDLDSLIYLDKRMTGSDVILKNYKQKLKINEIVVSSALKRKLELEINDFLLFRFGKGDVFLKVVDIIEENEIAVYQNPYWTYNFFKETLDIENLRSNLLIVNDNNLDLPDHYKISNPYKDVMESLNNSFKSTSAILDYLIIFINFSSLILIACLSYLLVNKLKKLLGTFLLLGMSRRGVCKILLFKHIVIMVLTSMLSIFYLHALKLLLNGFSIPISILADDIIKIVVYSLVTTIFSLFICITIFRRSSLLELIKNK